MEEEKKLAEKLNNYADENSDIECHLYKRRWIILSIFMIYAIAAGMQWMQYSIITNIVVKFYDVPPYLVEWTTMLHMLAYVICIFPALWMLDRMGNRITMITAGVGICIGAWIKMLSVYPHMFMYVLIGQAIEAASQVLTFGLAGSVTATWFGPNEISLAGSLALFGDQFGAALGFILPPLFVHNSNNVEEIGRGIYNLCLFIAIFSTVILVIMLIFFEDHPKKPPSNAQIVQKKVRKTENSIIAFKTIMSSRSFLLMLLTYGIHIGVFCSHATLLNRIFLFYYPSREKDAGIIGSLMVFFGLVGAVIGGLFLDWKHLFKQTTLFLYICSTICMVVYTLILTAGNLILVYMIACILGMFMLGYYSVGLQMAIEIIYPNSEGYAAGLMLLAVQTMGLILTPIYRRVLEMNDPLIANFSVVGLLLIGTLLTIKIPPHTKRQDAEATIKAGGTAKSFIIDIIKN